MATGSTNQGGISVDRFSVLLVAVAATLWASDAYFRNQLISHLSPTQIVVAEDALVTLFLLPVLIRSRSELPTCPDTQAGCLWDAQQSGVDSANSWPVVRS